MDPQKVFLLPTELHCSKEPAEISTLLGSCVAVCLFNHQYGFGGMNHFMLAQTPPGEAPSGKYGDYATRTLIKMMLSYDERAGNIAASVIGGGNVMGHLNFENSIGSQNILAAQEILRGRNIAVIGNKELGGDFGRKVLFRSWTGEIEVKRIEKSVQANEILVRQNDLNRRKIRVLVVDDSKTVRAILVHAISQDPQIEVVGQAQNPYEAREMLLESDPDVICLDIIMPRMDGLTFLKKLFLYRPKPVIIISSIAYEGSKIRQQARQIGAVEVIDKAELDLYAQGGALKTGLADKIKAAAVTIVKKKTQEEMDSLDGV